MQITVNEPGARTISESRPMQIDGQNVYVVVDSAASLFVGGDLVAVRKAAEVSSIADAQAWAVEYRENTPAAKHERAAAEVREGAAALLVEAEKMEAHGWAPLVLRNEHGRKITTIISSDPQHPMNAAQAVRREAARLAIWTAGNEREYVQYISDGLADTDGWYAPMSRYGWFVCTQQG